VIDARSYWRITLHVSWYDPIEAERGISSGSSGRIKRHNPWVFRTGGSKLITFGVQVAKGIVIVDQSVMVCIKAEPRFHGPLEMWLNWLKGRKPNWVIAVKRSDRPNNSNWFLALQTPRDANKNDHQGQRRYQLQPLEI